MILIKKDGLYVMKKGEIVNKFMFEDKKIYHEILNGNYSKIQDFLSKYPNEELVIDEKEEKSIMIEIAREKMKESIGEDYILVQILSAYDDIVSMLNLLSERIDELENVEEIKGEKIEECEKLREEKENLTSLRDYLGERIEKLSVKISPNLSALVGPIVAARLINFAGGTKRLAKMPSSTIQVLGAEDAFFQHLKKGTPCPKHGIIFQVPEIRNSPKKFRGKIARALAGKIAIAARVDFYHGESIGEKLKEEFKARVEEIKNDSHRKER